MSNNLPATKLIDKSLNHGNSDEREEKFIELLSVYKDEREAARQAGYSDQYARNIRHNKLKSERFLKKVKKAYSGNTILALPKLFQVESSTINLSIDLINDLKQALENESDFDSKADKINKAFGILAKTERTRSEHKRVAGVLQDEQTSPKAMIPIANVQNLLIQVHNTADSGNKGHID